jgi:asparagine synthetase B (glutamine-hydrolysing)
MTANLDALRKHRGKRVVSALSGGYDSAMVLAAAVKLYGAANVLAVTISGPKLTQDELRALWTVKQFHVEHRVYRYDVDDLLREAESGDPPFTAEIDRVFRFQYCASFRLFNREYEDREYDLITGMGADWLWGTKWRTYLYSADRAKREGISLEEARTRDKRDTARSHIGKDAGATFAREIARVGVNAVQPFLVPNLMWVADLPYSLADPNHKGFARDVLHLQGVDTRAVKRIGMEEGTNVYFRLKDELCKRYDERNANSAVKKLVSGWRPASIQTSVGCC